MSRFQDGPAAGMVMSLQRAPFFLRVVEDPGGAIDALDQLTDKPDRSETIHVYRKVSDDGTAFVDGCDAKTGKRFGYRLQLATYRLHETQPDDATARDSALWQAWCHAQAAEMAADAAE